MPQITLVFTPCEMKASPVRGRYDYDTPFETSLFSCDSSASKEKTYDLSKEASWWKETEHTIELPDFLDSVSAFRVDIKNEQLKGWRR